MPLNPQTAMLPSETAAITTENRNMLHRVVGWLAGHAGVDQFLDLGSWSPSATNTHDTASRSNPDSTVVYVHDDPAVIARGQTLLTDDDRAFFCYGDFTLPGEVLCSRAVTEHLDLERPVALLQFSTPHHIASLTEAQRVMAVYANRLPSGSFIALTHLLTSRTVDEVATMFGDYELLEPGVVAASDWWAGGPRLTLAPETARQLVGGVARKPPR